MEFPFADPPLSEQHVDKRMSVFPRQLSLRDDDLPDLPKTEALKTWSVDEVTVWLRSVDMAEVVPHFRGKVPSSPRALLGSHLFSCSS